MAYIEEKKHGIIIKVHVKPMSPENRLVIKDDELVFYSKEKPVKGKVNTSLLKFLSKKLNVSPVDIKIVSGKKDRYKVIMINGVTKKVFMEKLLK